MRMTLPGKLGMFYFFKTDSIYSEGNGSDSKESVHNVGDSGSVSGLAGSPGEGNGSLLQYSCLENFMNRGIWQALVHGVSKSQTRLRD